MTCPISYPRHPGLLGKTRPVWLQSLSEDQPKEEILVVEDDIEEGTVHM